MARLSGVYTMTHIWRCFKHAENNVHVPHAGYSEHVCHTCKAYMYDSVNTALDICPPSIDICPPIITAIFSQSFSLLQEAKSSRAYSHSSAEACRFKPTRLFDQK